MTFADQIARSHFSAKTIKALAKLGVKVIGLQGYSVTYDNGSTGSETAYCLDDNGTGRVRTFMQVLAMVGK